MFFVINKACVEFPHCVTFVLIAVLRWEAACNVDRPRQKLQWLGDSISHSSDQICER